jgi:hypothetical protein
MPYAGVFAATAWTALGPGTGAISAVPTETQRVSNWCWLATAVSVDRHFGGAATQCDLANAMLKQQSCCASPASSTCNRTGVVEEALVALGRHASTTALYVGTAPDLAVVTSELGAGRPPVAQLAFNGGANHVVVLAGSGVNGAGNEYLRVGDPSLGWNPTDLVWSQAHHYRGGVSWTHVCWTRP